MSKKKKPINFILPLVIYPFDIMVSFGQSDDQLKRYLKKWGIKWDKDLELAPTGLGRTAMLNGNQTVLRLKNVPVSVTDYSTLAHEIFHAVAFIMDRIGMSLVICQSDEAYAYLIGYITKEVYKRI